MARAVISSSLVKAAVHGRDPNWGRIVGAAGNARLADAAVLEAAGCPRRRRGAAAAARPPSTRSSSGSRSPATSSSMDRPAGRPPSTGQPSAAAMDAPEILVRLDLGLGDGRGRGLRLRPDRGLRHRELGVHDMNASSARRRPMSELLMPHRQATTDE